MSIVFSCTSKEAKAHTKTYKTNIINYSHSLNSNSIGDENKYTNATKYSEFKDSKLVFVEFCNNMIARWEYTPPQIYKTHTKLYFFT